MRGLNNETFAGLTSARGEYDRDPAGVGIVHFGVGNFHRSHQAMYLDRFLDDAGDPNWKICGVGLLEQDATMRDIMAKQDCLYTLILRHPDGTLEPSIISSIVEYLYAPDAAEEVFERLVRKTVSIATLTVTEGGYLKNPGTGSFDPSHPDAMHDIANPRTPRTVFGYLIEGLRRRREAGEDPFTILSCDNLQGNGDDARATVVGLAREFDAELAGWIEQNVKFPNCMVDRITPATTDDDREAARELIGLDDAWPVPAEPFTQWIIEDTFSAGRPALERVGVQFVEDVKPYELMKLRLLNAGHQAIAYLGAPLGYRYADETMRNERIRRFFETYMREEAAPTLGELPGIDLEAYMDTLVERFGNPKMRDTLARLATDGSNRMPTFTLPAIRENLAAGRPIRLGATMCAAWAEYWRLIGLGEIATEDLPADVRFDDLRSAALDDSPAAFIEQRDLFGDLADNATFAEQFLAARANLAADGVPATLAELLDGPDAGPKVDARVVGPNS